MDALTDASRSGSLSGALTAPVTAGATASTLDPSGFGNRGAAAEDPRKKVSTENPLEEVEEDSEYADLIPHGWDPQDDPLSVIERNREIRQAEERGDIDTGLDPNWTDQPTPPTVETQPAPAPPPEVVAPPAPPPEVVAPVPVKSASIINQAQQAPTEAATEARPTMMPEEAAIPYQDLNRPEGQLGLEHNYVGVQPVEPWANPITGDDFSQYNMTPTVGDAGGILDSSKYGRGATQAEYSDPNATNVNTVTPFGGVQTQPSPLTGGIEGLDPNWGQTPVTTEEQDKINLQNEGYKAAGFVPAFMEVYGDIIKGMTPHQVGSFASEVFLKMTR